MLAKLASVVMKQKTEKHLPGSGIEVRFNEGWFETSPHCPHGPMLLFEKYMKFELTSRYFACSANRDRKSCNYYITEQEFKKKGFNKSSYTPVESYEDSHPVFKSKTFCFTCQCFIPDGKSPKHKQHKVVRNISEDDLKKPSTLFLSALENNKTCAQYFLSEKSTRFLYNVVIDHSITHVICIGMPRLHEYIQSTSNISSILLDIDNRYKMFWSNEQFCRFNMFNRHFFNPTSKLSFKKFLKSAEHPRNIVVVVDPPFGGLVDCVCESLKWISRFAFSLFGQNSTQLLTTLWLFPYFMEKRIKNQLQLTMLDYRVDYENHRKFKEAKHGRYMSPVRIFTNIKNKTVRLPSPDYRFCELCQRFVAKDNLHCKLCNDCPSKDGRTYRHCNICQICVKPGRKHCKTCDRCQPPLHSCNPHTSDGCHSCGEATHKRKDCPLLLNHQKTEVSLTKSPNLTTVKSCEEKLTIRNSRTGKICGENLPTNTNQQIIFKQYSTDRKNSSTEKNKLLKFKSRKRKSFFSNPSHHKRKVILLVQKTSILSSANPPTTNS
uniref:zinc finger CCHC domain-containing protein 4 isoform X1 n=1 Tax=Ciona intestinalis TaxID=7719 RepID=UPI000180D30C|nr:zinc finger CCHC domain-containing protein 4 isoform X1 [Ciona intestinalis]|eukprot:XP_002124158.1 zinc finger CCHC domain-containing protein 4 isoform X1 [Ciona intestinalis]